MSDPEEGAKNIMDSVDWQKKRNRRLAFHHAVYHPCCTSQVDDRGKPSLLGVRQEANGCFRSKGVRKIWARCS